MFHCEQVIVLNGVFLMLCHGAVIDPQDCNGDDHDQGQQGIIVIGDGPDKEHQAVGPFRRETGNSRRPGGDRRDDADGRRRSVDQIGQFGPGNVMSVCDRPHDAADGQAVEIVINKDQDTQCHGRQLGAHTGPDMFGSPLAERRGTARLVHQLDHDAQEDQEDQDADIVSVRQLGDHALLENMGQGAYKTETGIKETADNDTDEQRAVDLLGDQCQGDRDDRRQQCPKCTIHSVISPFSSKIKKPARAFSDRTGFIIRYFSVGKNKKIPKRMHIYAHRSISSIKYSMAFPAPLRSLESVT